MFLYSWSFIHQTVSRVFSVPGTVLESRIQKDKAGREERYAWKTLGWCKRRVHRSLQNPQRGHDIEASFPGTSPIFFLLACQLCPKLNLLPSLLPSLPPPMLLLPPPTYTTTPSPLSFLCQVHLYPTVYLQLATPKSDSTPFSHHIWFHQCSLTRTLF